MIFLMGETHAAELARLLDLNLSTVQNAVDSLEQTGVVSGAIEGRSRRLRLNPRYFARDEIGALLEKMASGESGLRERIATVRRRPRRAGKPL